MTNLSRYEQETIITYNNEEKTANVYTYDKSLIRQINSRLSDFPDIKLIRNGEDWAEYSLPKNYIKVRFPRQISDEQRQAMAERMKSIRQGTNNNGN